jgi:LacI family transcriptional regulator
LAKKINITQQDLAARIGVSRITVSKALRDHPDISEEMKKKVRAAAEKAGYSPNLLAANLSTSQTKCIGIVVPDLENSFFAYIIDTMIDLLADAGYSTILAVSRERAENEAKNIRNLISLRVDGLLVCTSQMTKNTEVFKYAGKTGIPLVFFDRGFPGMGLSTVTFDDRKGVINAIDHFAALGFTEIAHFAGYSYTNIGRERSGAFKYAMKKNRLETRKEWLIEGGFETSDGRQAFEKVYGTGKLPQLILAVNDRVALGVYQAASEKKIKIPSSLSVAGFGFRETAELFSPALTVIDQDPRVMGAEAVKILLSEINGENQRKRVKVPVGFVLNRSVKLLNRNKR